MSTLPQRAGLAPCAQPITAVPQPAATDPRVAARNDAVPGSTGQSDARERARRALDAQQSPIPRSGPLQDDAAAGAEQCVRLLHAEFNLRTVGSGKVPDEAAIKATLTDAGLIDPVVQPGPRFAASTGAACILGTFRADGPAMTLSSLSSAAPCRP